MSEKKYTQADVDSFLIAVMRKSIPIGVDSERDRIIALLEAGWEDVGEMVAAIRAPDDRDPVDVLRAMAASKR